VLSVTRKKRSAFLGRTTEPSSESHILGWKAARRRAAARYQEEAGRAAPEGFRRVRVHDLKHTCGRRLRAAGVGLEDRQDILGHKSGRNHDPLQRSGDRQYRCGGESDSRLTRNSRENRSKVGSVICKSLKRVGGKGGTRTLDPGMSAGPKDRALAA